MRRKGLATLCVLAAVATAFAATTASAAPVFYTKAAIGEVGKPVPFTGTLGPAFLEGHTSHAKITCVGGTGSGDLDGEALALLRAHAFAYDLTLDEVAAAVVTRRLRLDPDEAGEPAG